MSQPQANGTRVKIEFAEATDPGRDPNKQINEDACGYNETRFGHLIVLCDGMGGHYGGREASHTAIATIFEMMDKASPTETPRVALKAAIEEAGRRVFQLGGAPENRGRPGSTVVAMLLGDQGLDVAHVGDSRAYCIRAGQIYPLTRDHSMVQGMIDAGMLSEAEAIGHPDANKITRALGMRPDVEVEVRPEAMELFPGDIVLQSSDGLTDLVMGVDILGAVRQSLNAGPIPYATKQLVQLANDRGGHDNITVQMVRVVDVPPRASLTIPQAPAGEPDAGRPPPPQETRNMTAPERPAPTLDRPAPTLGLPPKAAGPTLQSPGAPAPPPQGFAPVQPTAVDRPMGASPTVLETPPPSHAHGHKPAQTTLTPFSSQLPLPPPSARYAAPQVTQVPSSSPVVTHGITQGPPSHAPSSTMNGARPSQTGIIYVIIGMSAVIAVLLLLLIWALFLR